MCEEIVCCCFGQTVNKRAKKKVDLADFTYESFLGS